MNLRSFCAFLGENNHRAGRNSRRDRRLEIGKTRSRRKSASFSGLGRKTSPETGQKSEFSELLKNGSSSEAKVLKRYGRLLAAPAAFRERVEFRANRLVGLHTHEGVGDRTERPFFGPKSGGWGGVSGCHQSSTCRRYYRGVETKSGIGQMKSCQISVKAMGAWRDERFSGRPGAGSLPPRRPARGSRKRARLCRVARAGKRFRRQCLPARHAAPSREPEIGLCSHTPLGKSMGPTGPRWLMNGGAANRARRQSVPPVAVGSRPGSVGLHGRVKASDGTWPFSVKMTTGRDEIHAVADGWKSAKRAPGENRPPSPD